MLSTIACLLFAASPRSREVQVSERGQIPSVACATVPHGDEDPMRNKRVRRFHNEITKLKNLLARLAKTIADKDAERLLLGTAKNSLGIVERCLLPHGLKATNDNTEMWFRLTEFHLEVAEAELKFAEDAVAKATTVAGTDMLYAFCD